MFPYSLAEGAFSLRGDCGPVPAMSISAILAEDGELQEYAVTASLIQVGDGLLMLRNSSAPFKALSAISLEDDCWPCCPSHAPALIILCASVPAASRQDTILIRSSPHVFRPLHVLGHCCAGTVLLSRCLRVLQPRSRLTYEEVDARLEQPRSDEDPSLLALAEVR